MKTIIQMKTASVTGAFAALLLLAGALPAAAQLATPPTDVAAPASNTARDSYLQEAGNKIAVWKQQVSDFNSRAVVTGHQDSVAARQDLNEAWAKTEAAGRDMQAAGADGWERTKGAFESASHAFTAEFDKIRS